MLPQLRLHRRDAHGRDALDDAVLTHEPQGQVNVVDGAVHKDAAAELGVGHKEARGVELVARLRPEDGRAANLAVLDPTVGVPVRGVEPPREAAEDLLRGEPLDGPFVGVHNRLGLEEGGPPTIS